MNRFKNKYKNYSFFVIKTYLHLYVFSFSFLFQNKLIEDLSQELNTLQVIKNEITTNYGEWICENVFILDGVTTLVKIIDIINQLIENYSKDIQLRKEIVDDMKKATSNQMAVYVSTWKYSPLIDSSIENQLKQVLENELLQNS